MKVKSRMVCPVEKDGKWTTMVKEFEEDVPDQGRDNLFCNACGYPDYPNCKENFCKAWMKQKIKDER